MLLLWVVLLLLLRPMRAHVILYVVLVVLLLLLLVLHGRHLVMLNVRVTVRTIWLGRVHHIAGAWRA